MNNYGLVIEREHTPRTRGVARICIRPSKHREAQGWLIYGKDTLGRSVRCWCQRRQTAEHIRDRLRLGLELTLADFQGGSDATD